MIINVLRVDSVTFMTVYIHYLLIKCGLICDDVDDIAFWENRDEFTSKEISFFFFFLWDPF